MNPITCMTFSVCRPNNIFTLRLLFIFQLVCLSFYSLNLNASDETAEKISQLDAEFKSLITEFYNHQARAMISEKNLAQNFETFSSTFSAMVARQDNVEAVSFIHANLNMLELNINDDVILQVIKTLLDNHDYQTAIRLKGIIDSVGEQYYVSNLGLIFADYYDHRNQWQQVLSSLDIDFEELTPENAHRAALLVGIALQKQKQHRKAIKSYENIPESSTHFPLAQLNTALAYIRQDWWTDAHILIKRLLKQPAITNNEELVNRLSLILGFSLLNKEYYRESRESFRNISLDSQYASMALLGISLAAIGQEDSLGALNAASILNKKETQELVVEESYLLLPHIYKNLEQYETANSSYTLAINHYQNKLSVLRQLMDNSQAILNDHLVEPVSGKLTIGGIDYNLSEHYPSYFFSNFAETKKLRKLSQVSTVSKKLDILEKKQSELLVEIFNKTIQHRIDAVQSYLSQAHFGVAQLYDKEPE
ncbi:hypothetical protein FLL45_00110 [Aliikangiella marina]|uniref:Tetratricopeptide repeat protein n=1 Tax=Aliikangiella marina TaxID=1712262 RepID=A0A545TGQ0_9GAMM|nr:hypothetical protein [Aliikangiella marina]TQV76407.1 hypothetical protein FLL45_00110 [Aliikangiella marina]